MSRFINLTRLICVIALSAVAALSQTADANLVGSVLDQSGAAITEAEMQLVNLGTGVEWTSRTDSQGQYRFSNVPVGRYKLTATRSGFTTQTINNIDLDLNRAHTVNMSLGVSSVATVIEVIEAGALIDTTTATVQSTFTTKQALDLPITGAGGLGVLNLSLLSAGVTSSGGVGYGTGPSVGGQRPTNNNFMIEGVDNNNRGVTGPVVDVSNEFVQEFSLQQNQFATEFGHSSGGQFNTVVRSGTNSYHGSIFHYFQNRNLNAMDEADRRIGLRNIPRYDQNRLGATFGGPIIRNKLFFFLGAEYNNIGSTGAAAGQLLGPTAEGIRLLESLPQVSRLNLGFLREWVPQAGSRLRDVRVAGQNIPVGVLSITGASFENNYRPVLNIDYVASANDQIRMRWLYERTESIENTPNIPAFFTPIALRSHIGSLAWFRNIKSNLLNEFRFGWNRRVDDRPIGDWSFGNLEAFPNVWLNDLGLNIGPNGNYPQAAIQSTYQITNNMSWIKGRHTLKFGYDGRKVNGSTFFVQRQRGDYIYNTLERFMLDITPEFAQRSGGAFPFVANLLSHYAYVNDEWRVRPNLTVNLGLRYEFVDVPAGAMTQAFSAAGSVPGVIEFAAPEPTTRDFAPRVGLAWSPGSSGRTSIRAGFGMAYDQVYQNLGTNSLPARFFTTIDSHIDQANEERFMERGGIRYRPIPVESPQAIRGLTSSYIPLLQERPYSLQWNVGIQQVLGQDYTVEARYLGTRGVDLPFQTQLNRRALVTADRTLPTFFDRPTQAQLDALPLTLAQIEAQGSTNIWAPLGFTRTVTSFMPIGQSTYHGLALQLNKRFSNGFQYVAAYTFSSAIDDSTAALFSTVTTPRRPQDFQNLKAERAHSALDRRNRFSFTWVYDTPWFRDSSNWAAKNLLGNWTYSGSYIAETGAWGTPRSDVDSNINGDNAGDRTIINVNGREGVGSGVTALRNSANQIVGYLANNPDARYVQAGRGVYPNAGRNTLRLPGINNFDMAVAKRVNITERWAFEFRAEAYNALNNSQFIAGFPSIANLRSRTAGAVTQMLLPQNPNFNRPDLAFQSNARTMQLVGRITF